MHYGAALAIVVWFVLPVVVAHAQESKKPPAFDWSDSFASPGTSLRDEGLATIRASSGVNVLLLAGFADGHPLDVALVSDDFSKRAHAKAVPIPLRKEAAGGCSASAELQSETGLLFLLILQGFRPQEAVHLQSERRNEVLRDTVTASDIGAIRFPVLFGRGERGTARFIATTSGCSVTLEYKIGVDALVR